MTAATMPDDPKCGSGDNPVLLVRHAWSRPPAVVGQCLINGEGVLVRRAAHIQPIPLIRFRLKAECLPTGREGRVALCNDPQ